MMQMVYARGIKRPILMMYMAFVREYTERIGDGIR